MNKLMFKLKKKLVNKKENTRKLKYESLLEENKKKNEEIINLLYERNELKDIKETNESLIEQLKNRNLMLEEKINSLEDKKAELLHELETLRVKKRVKKND